MRISLLKNYRGDTIVEVLIAILILTLVLTGAYTATDNSLRNITDAGQRTKALDIAQGQVEVLRAQASTSAFSTYVAGNSCYDTATSAFVAFSTANCTSQAIYVSEISFVPTSQVPINLAATGLSTYKVTVTWPSAIQNGTDRVTLYYQVVT